VDDKIMADANSMMFIRPNTCHDCGNGFYALQHCVEYANGLSWNTLDLSEELARKQPVYNSLDTNDPLYLYGFGHGNTGIYTGQGEPPEIIFRTTECDKLNGRIVYLLSCLTGIALGPAIIEAGALAYAGFNISWSWIIDPQNPEGTGGDPYEDLYAISMYDSANELWYAISDGDGFSTAVQRSVDKYTEWIDYWFYENPGAPYSQQCIGILASNRDSLVALYNCDGLEEPLCNAAGCDWTGSNCLNPPPVNGGGGIGLPRLVAVAFIAIIGIGLIVGQTDYFKKQDKS